MEDPTASKPRADLVFQSTTADPLLPPRPPFAGRKPTGYTKRGFTPWPKPTASRSRSHLDEAAPERRIFDNSRAAARRIDRFRGRPVRATIAGIARGLPRGSRFKPVWGRGDSLGFGALSVKSAAAA